MLHFLIRKSLPFLLLATSAAAVNAQTFEPPLADEFTYGSPFVKYPESTSAHSMRAGAAYFPVSGFLSADLYVAAWSDPNPGALSEVTILITTPNNPTSWLWDGTIQYTDVQGLEVGSVRDIATNQTCIIAAYYRAGIGYFLDKHGIDASGNIYLINQTFLASSPTYGRIRMDFHSLWSGAVAWINTDPSVNAIQAQVYDNNAWSATSTFTGTADKTDMDLSLEHIDLTTGGSSYKELHLTYAGSGFITESSVNFYNLYTTPGLYTPAVNDNDYIGGMYISRINMDCPGFSIDGSRWAYTYTDNNDVFVRHYDPAVAGSAQTSVVTAGTPGNTPITGQYKMFAPALNYEFSSFTFGVPSDIMVTWCALDASGQTNYIGLKIDPFGNLASNSDYLNLPNAQTPSVFNPFLCGIALNRTDVKTPSPYSYATYFDIDPVTGGYQLHHAFHKWNTPYFRGLPGENEKEISNARISSYPNPFRDQLNLSVELQEHSIVELLLTDISGRTVAQTNHALEPGSQQVKMDQLSQLAPGNYILTILVNQKQAGVQKVTKY